MLCGACEEGYSEALGSTACRLSAACNDLAWFTYPSAC
jgi:hypothetical protein